MDNSREYLHDDLRRKPPPEAMVSISEIIRATTDNDNRRHAPLEGGLPNGTSGYEWMCETGQIQSYKHNQTEDWLHIDP